MRRQDNILHSERNQFNFKSNSQSQLQPVEMTLNLNLLFTLSWILNLEDNIEMMKN